MNPHHKNRYEALDPNQGTYLPPLDTILGVSHYPPSVENRFLHHNTQVPSNSRHGEGALQSGVGVYNQRYFFNADQSNSQGFFQQQYGLRNSMRTVSNIPLCHEKNNLDRLNFLEAGLTQYTSSCSINPSPCHDDSSNTNNRLSDSFQEDKIPENSQNDHQNYCQNASKKNKRKNLLTKQLKLRKIGNNDTNKQFVLRDYQNICTYLEDTNNCKALFGEVKKTRIGEPLMTKTAAFSLFACYLNNQNRGLNLTGRNCQQRFATYKAKYIATNRFAKETGAGLTMEELGGLTLSAKLEAMCPCYDRMDQLFGHKANVQPAFAIDSGKIAHDDIVDRTNIGNAF
ncbi:hypothetical protein O181_070215, partial [Austropuccinia psidii MF-1]|nr:hypothetical protein [Austropuccinia psidii MF-1]